MSLSHIAQAVGTLLSSAVAVFAAIGYLYREPQQQYAVVWNKAA